MASPNVYPDGNKNCLIFFLQAFHPFSVQLHAARNNGPCPWFLCHPSFMVECLCRNDEICRQDVLQGLLTTAFLPCNFRSLTKSWQSLFSTPKFLECKLSTKYLESQIVNVQILSFQCLAVQILNSIILRF